MTSMVSSLGSSLITLGGLVSSPRLEAAPSPAPAAMAPAPPPAPTGAPVPHVQASSTFPPQWMTPGEAVPESTLKSDKV